MHNFAITPSNYNKKMRRLLSNVRECFISLKKRSFFIHLNSDIIPLISKRISLQIINSIIKDLRP
jgi:hypothetical protein